jgi:hypothetical protein
LSQAKEIIVAFAVMGRYILNNVRFTLRIALPSIVPAAGSIRRSNSLRIISAFRIPGCVEEASFIWRGFCKEGDLYATDAAISSASDRAAPGIAKTHWRESGRAGSIYSPLCITILNLLRATHKIFTTEARRHGGAFVGITGRV